MPTKVGEFDKLLLGWLDALTESGHGPECFWNISGCNGLKLLGRVPYRFNVTTHLVEAPSKAGQRHTEGLLSSVVELTRCARIEPVEPGVARVARVARRMFGVRAVLICWRATAGAECIGFFDAVAFNVRAVRQALGQAYPELFLRERAALGDTWKDPGFSGHKVAIAGRELRSCATSVIHAPDGSRIGTLCVLDTEPRVWGPAELESLEDLAALVEQHLELDAASQRLSRAHETQAALEESEALFQDLANASDEVFWVTDIGSGSVLYVSPAYERVWKRSVASLLENADNWIVPIHPEDREKTERAYAEGLAADRGFEVEFRIVLPDGSVRHVLNRGFPVHDAGGHLIRMAGIASDITELHLAREALRTLAETDDLTGALNSRAFRRLLRHELTRSARERRPLCVALLDIDNFKAVNDEHGHLAGDCVLTQVVRVLRGRLRASDIVARLGGDEFCVVLPNADEEGAARVLAELSAEVARMKVPLGGGRSVSVTLSVGIAVASSPSDEAELLKRADDALYTSKRDGRNRVSVAPKAVEAARG